jgi:hypothetical protein
MYEVYSHLAPDYLSTEADQLLFNLAAIETTIDVLEGGRLKSSMLCNLLPGFETTQRLFEGN